MHKAGECIKSLEIYIEGCVQFVLRLRPMREINEHQVQGAQQSVAVMAIDEPSNGGASHLYALNIFPLPGVGGMYALPFQKGGIAEVGVNGITNEALLAVVLDRLRGFQSGPFPNRDNAIAITHLEDALSRLQRRTRDRVARGVEGKMQA